MTALSDILHLLVTANLWQATLAAAVLLLLPALGGVVSERSGVVNIAMEGMMLTGAFAAAVAAWATGNPVLGLGLGILAVLPVAALQAFLSVTLRANQIVTGIGINILMLGATTLAYREIFGARSREQIPGLMKWKPPVIGDIPIFVAHDSADVWQDPEAFFLDEEGQPTVIAGCPPDYFSATGQRWGNPLYRWRRMKQHGYPWWISRLRSALRRVSPDCSASSPNSSRRASVSLTFS